MGFLRKKEKEVYNNQNGFYTESLTGKTQSKMSMYYTRTLKLKFMKNFKKFMKNNFFINNLMSGIINKTRERTKLQEETQKDNMHTT